MTDRASAKRNETQAANRNRASRVSEEWERFETLLDRLLRDVVRASAHAIDREIEHWLSHIVLTLDIDRTTVWERTSDDQGFITRLWWARPGITPMPAPITSMQISPWATAKILAGENVVYSRFEDIPKEAKELRAFAERHGPSGKCDVAPAGWKHNHRCLELRQVPFTQRVVARIATTVEDGGAGVCRRPRSQASRGSGGHSAAASGDCGPAVNDGRAGGLHRA